ncbi:hypothetical protein ACDI35_19330 [Xanthomonas axonopodis pv. cajani]|uniref:hypothetical protein n=1 Tax=Xanthomonas axonopodis TaxID=53413 RepID=UPI003558C7EB
MLLMLDIAITGRRRSSMSNGLGNLGARENASEPQGYSLAMDVKMVRDMRGVQRTHRRVARLSTLRWRVTGEL